jgi:CHAT domain-containing protein
VPHGKGCTGRRELLLVLEGELYLVPFPILKPGGSEDSSEYLCERFSLLVVPSLMSLRSNQRSTRTVATSKTNTGPTESTANMSALVIGNPLLPVSVTEQWGWGDIPHAEQEAVMVADMLQSQALVAAQVLHSRRRERRDRIR